MQKTNLVNESVKDNFHQVEIVKVYHRQTLLENDISQIYHRQFLSITVKIHCSKNVKIRVLKCATGKNIFKYQCGDINVKGFNR